MLSIFELKDLFKSKQDSIRKDYFTFLEFESIATDSAYTPSVRSCADWLKNYIEKIGLKVEVWEDAGAPILFATDLRAGSEKDTVLLYCHYDVQPVDPLNLWTSPPFQPEMRNGKIYARGAVDNKGQCFYTIWAIKILLEKLEKLSINLKFIIEGEEESGSHSLARLLPYKKEALKADHILIIDAGIEEPGQPAISLGARGLTCMTVHLTGSGFDLHSGAHGGIVYNPNQALIELLSPLHDATRSISIPGFYDDVIVVSESEKSQYHLDFDEKKFEHHFKAKAIGMEKGVQPLESAWMRPTLEINGLSGGYSGPGFKTVIPSKAMAKISCRLVPNQDPYKIAQIVKNYLISHIKPGIEIEVEIHPGNGKPLRTNPQSKIVRLMEKAFEEVFQKKCHRILLGGSIPIAADLAETAGGEMLLVGVGLPTDQIHAPDEHFDWERFEQGFLFMATALQLF